MPYSKDKINIMQHLGTGLSVDSLCKACEITYNELCKLAQEHMDLYSELKKWYKRFDFTPKTAAIIDACEKLEEAGVNYTLKVDLDQEEDNSLKTNDNPKPKAKKAKKKVETK